MARRVRDGDPSVLADGLEQCSSGGQNRWPEVLESGFGCDVDFVVGELDAKFVKIAQDMTRADVFESIEAPEGADIVPGVKLWPVTQFRVAEVQGSGHAVHEEQPIALLSAPVSYTHLTLPTILLV